MRPIDRGAVIVEGYSVTRSTHLLSVVALMAAAMPAHAADPPSQRGEAALAKLIAGRVPGKPLSCLTQRDLRSSQTLDGTAIVYESFGTLYVNRPNGASSLDSDDILVTRTVGSQLCRSDTVTLIDRGSRFQRGFVILNDFVPYRRAPKKP